MSESNSSPPASRITGQCHTHPDMASAYLERSRTVLVWLPPSYDGSPEKRYPTLYMHDGQQIFDPATSTWGQDWEVDEWCDKLIRAGELQECIVVGIYCTPARREEYSTLHYADGYTRFVVEELKPFIDSHYRTLPDRKHTAIAGSSMGGGISFHILWTRPDIFSAAACLSSAFTYKQSPLLLQRVRDAESVPDIRLYLYCGEGDELERILMHDLRLMRETLAKKGFQEGPRLLIEVDPEGKHNEATWAKHTGTWLRFLFGKEVVSP